MLMVDLKNRGVQSLKDILKSTGIKPVDANPILSSLDSALISQQVKSTSIITRPNVTLKHIASMDSTISDALLEWDTQHEGVSIQTEIQLKYEGYIQREQDMAIKMIKLDELIIPHDVDFNQFSSISLEAREKFNAIKPVTIGQASRISGVSPSDVSVLLIYLGR
jgi:tRNA uridine 5-carboxymethylaminomethyl modification enzyme